MCSRHDGSSTRRAIRTPQEVTTCLKEAPLDVRSGGSHGEDRI
jgi:hypothetical protein